MVIPNDKVKQIQALSVDIGELIVSLNPVTIKEWDAFNKLVDAHKNLMKIDTDSLLQLQLPLPSKSSSTPSYREDCPRCEGTGEWAYPEAPLGPFYDCNCWEISEQAWPQVKKEWEEALAPAEV